MYQPLLPSGCDESTIQPVWHSSKVPGHPAITSVRCLSTPGALTPSKSFYQQEHVLSALQEHTNIIAAAIYVQSLHHE